MIFKDKGCILMAIFLILFLQYVNEVQAQGVQQYNPVAYWSCDEDSGVRYDSTANNNDLSDYNSVASTTGLLNNGCHFVASNSEYLYIDDADITGLDGLSAMTFGAWVKYDSLPSSGNSMRFLSKRIGLDPSDYSYNSALHNNSGTRRLRWEVDDGTNESQFFMNWSPSIDTWYHIAWTWDGSTGETQFYVDGSPYGSIQTDTAVTTFQDTSTQLRIGASLTNSQNMDGVYDELFITDSVLSTSDISTIYNGGVGYGYIEETETSTSSLLLVPNMINSSSCITSSTGTDCSFDYATTTPDTFYEGMMLLGGFIVFFLAFYIIKMI